MPDGKNEARCQPAGPGPVTPLELVATSELAKVLRLRGATDADLASLHFSKFDPALPFSMWAIVGPDWLVRDHHGLCKAYCAFRWLILDNPPSSRNKDDAWAYVGQIEAADIYRLGIETRENQKKRAARPRAVRGDLGETLHEVVQALISKPEHRTLRSKQLWLHFYSALDDHGFDPKEVVRGDSRKAAYSYVFEDRRRQISYGAFSNLVSKFKKKSH